MPNSDSHGGFSDLVADPLPGEEYNVGLAARMLAGTVIKRDTFSQ
jgi:hypothetical protein